MTSTADDNGLPYHHQSQQQQQSQPHESSQQPHSQYNNQTTMTLLDDDPQSLSHLSTSILTSKLQNLQLISSSLTSTLTSKLASSQSLLHIGPSLSTLPPDLQTIVDVVSPMVEETRRWNGVLEEERGRIRRVVEFVESERRRGVEGEEACVVLEDLMAVEKLLFGEGEEEEKTSGNGAGGSSKEAKDHYGDDDNIDDDSELDYASSLERAAHTCLHLLQHLQSASNQVTTTTTTTTTTNNTSSKNQPKRTKNTNTTNTKTYSVEMAQFLLRLSPRIRRLESETIRRVKNNLESVLKERTDRRREQRRQRRNLEPTSNDTTALGSDTTTAVAVAAAAALEQRITELELLKIGHLLRSLALLDKISDAESIFANTSIMPLIRRNLSIARLDEGGNRSECKGLGSWLEDVVRDVSEEWGDVLRLGEGMFGDLGGVGVGEDDGGRMDLVCGGVWVPIAAALMTDPVVRMAIFSPGIAGVLQANYVALDAFLSKLATNLLQPQPTAIPSTTSSESNAFLQDDGTKTINEVENTNIPNTNLLSHYYYRPNITSQTISLAQSRLYHHRTTVEFYKRWNLPIYYQLRFGEACSRLDKIIEATRINGWWYKDEKVSNERGEGSGDCCGLELSVFLELRSILDWLWQDNVFLRPLTHRFLRGAIQLLGRVLGFVRDGLEGSIEFGGRLNDASFSRGEGDVNEAEGVDSLYRWVDRIEDVAAVSWELSVLQSYVAGDYTSIVSRKVAPSPLFNIESERTVKDKMTREEEELNPLIHEVLADACADLSPLIDRMWNERIVSILTARCTAPLSAVKGVAATYRMTNRPPPTQASPFVHTILRPIREFIATFAAGKTPEIVGSGWKAAIVSTVSKGYSVAVAELIETVQRTEEALKNRKARSSRMSTSGIGKSMSDGEKVKLQLYLDREEFVRCVEEVGVDPELVEGVNELKRLTDSAEGLYRKTHS